MIRQLAGCAAVAVATLLSIPGMMSPDVLKWSLLSGILACLCWVRPRYSDLTFWGLGFIAWASVTLLWAGDWREGVDQLIHIGVAFGLFVALSSVRTDWIPRAALAAVAGALLLYVASPEDWGTFNNANFLTEFVAIGAALAWRGKWFPYCGLVMWPVMLGSAWFVFVESPSNIRWLLLAAAGAWVVYRSWGRSRFTTIATILALADLSLWMGWADGRDIVYSLGARFEIWAAAVAMFVDHPMGVGFGSFNYNYDAYAEAYRRLSNAPSILVSPVVYPGVPHNEILQVATETGIVGLIVATCFLRRIKWNLPLLVSAVLSMVGFPAHNAATAILIVMALAVTNPGKRVVTFPSFLRYPAAGVLTAGLLSWSGLTVKAHADYTAAIFGLKVIGDPARAFQFNVSAVETYPLERAYRHQLSLTLRDAMHQENVVVKEDAADLAWRISRTASAGQLGLVMARVEYLLNSGRFNEPETLDLIERLKIDQPNSPNVWAMDAVYGVMTGDFNRAAVALERGDKLPYTPEKETFYSISKLLTEQKE